MLERKISEALPEAMKMKNHIGVSVLRMMVNEIKNYKISEKIHDSLDDAIVVSILQKMAKKYRESIESFEKGGRSDLVEKENAELSFLKGFLPKPLSDKELMDIVQKALNQTGATSMKDLAIAMKAVMPLVAGRADGRMVSSLVREKLSC